MHIFPGKWQSMALPRLIVCVFFFAQHQTECSDMAQRVHILMTQILSMERC